MQQFDYSGAPDERAPSRPPAIVYATGSVGGIVTVANTLLAAIIIVALARNEFSALTAIIVGGTYYGVTTLAALLILSGSLTSILTARQEQITLRQYHRLHLTTPSASIDAGTVSVVPPMQLPDTTPTDPAPPAGLPLTNSYVAPQTPTRDIDEATRREAVAWVLQLYGADGQPDPKKVLLETDRERPGRIRIAGPGREAKRYLLERHILHSLGNGYRLNLLRCPTITAAQNHLR